MLKRELAAAKKPADKAALAEKLLGLAADSSAPAEQFALLSEARRLAIAAGAPALAFRAVDQLAESFALDRFEESAQTAEELTGRDLSPAMKKELVESIDPLTAAALEGGQFAAGRRLAVVGVAAARKTKQSELLKALTQRGKELAAAEKLATGASGSSKPASEHAPVTQRGKGGPGVVADKLVLWNCHCNHWKDRGLLSAHIELRKANQVVWSKRDIAVAWSKDEEPATTIPLPRIAFDALRVETASYHGEGTALCEVEILRGGINVARGKPVRASGSHQPALMPDAIVDGIRDSANPTAGYWQGPNQQLAWVEIQVAPSAATRRNTIYLADLPVMESRIFAEAVISDRHPVSGVKCEHSLSVHPDHGSSSRVLYKLDKKYLTLSGAAAIGDTPAMRSANPLTFRIVADGKELWRTTIQDSGKKHPVQVSVAGVKNLELFVDCPGSADFAHALWVEPELVPVGSAKAPPRPTAVRTEAPGTAAVADKPGIRGVSMPDRLVIWNTHNYGWNDRGTLTCNVSLLQAGRTVWSKNEVSLDWKPDADLATTVELPGLACDAVRVETTSFQELGPGLCEIEVYQGKKNLALGKLVSASGFHNNGPPPDAAGGRHSRFVAADVRLLDRAGWGQCLGRSAARQAGAGRRSR